MRQRLRLIGLTGTNASGKGEAAAFFQTRGFSYVSLSDVIRQELRRQGRELTRDSLIEAGNRLREQCGPDILARRVMERVAGDSVIDSIRNPSEIEFLRTQGDFVLLAIDAPLELRFERAWRRGRDESAASLEAFRIKEDEERTLDPAGQQLTLCMRMADVVIVNAGSLEEFHRRLEAVL